MHYSIGTITVIGTIIGTIQPALHYITAKGTTVYDSVSVSVGVTVTVGVSVSVTVGVSVSVGV